MDYKTALNKCMIICSKKEYCSYDIVKKLNQWEVNTEHQDKIMQKLFDDRFIDHLRYTKAYVNDKFKINHWGKIKIKYQLQLKKIESNIIIDALTKIDQNEYKKTIITEISKKQNSINVKSGFERNQKIARYVISKGFEPSLVFELLKIDESLNM